MADLVAKVDVKAIKDIKKKFRNLLDPVDEKTSKELGVGIVKRMLRFIKKGASTIARKGRYKAYKKSYQTSIKRGTGVFRTKKLRPVNLKLTGAFLKDLSHKPADGGTAIFYSSDESDIKEQGHREGANNQKKRPTIPIKREKFNETIQDFIVSTYDKRIKKLIR